ncbi:MAG: hypothetical protein KA371_16400 [Acidobacteria bacterium]|nr:hypothetical protein [Acidobacteriota bacterium]
MTVMVDTNVILAANRQHTGVSETCIVSCAQRLHAIMTGGRVAIDDDYRILKEYQHKTTPHVGKRAGDAFVKWLLRNNANTERCDQVALVEHPERGFESFPEDARLTTFDPTDRKFVAVACAHEGHPPIAQATDSKWLDWAPALREYGVNVEFLCRADIQGFDDKKKARYGNSR